MYASKRLAVIEKAKEAQKSQQRKEEEELKSGLRQNEMEKAHQFRMEYEALRHKNKMEELYAKASKDEAEETEEVSAEEDECELLPSQNIDTLVNTRQSEQARIKYLGPTYVQNRDIMLLYGPPGIGKSHEIVDVVAEITTGRGARKGIPFAEKIDLPYKAIYYDKEPDDTEWIEKFGGRRDLKNAERVPCRDSDDKRLLKDIKLRISEFPKTNYIIVIDPLTNFDIKSGGCHEFVNELANIQDAEFAAGRNITFLLIAHAVKDPKGKGLSDLGGSKFWGESVKTVVSLMPAGPNDCFRKLTFDKTKNGKEVTRGTSFILRPENTPHRHHNYDEELTNEYRSSGKVNGKVKDVTDTKVKVPKRRGKLADVSPEDANLMFKMKKEGLPSADIADSVGKKYNLYPTEVDRLISDMEASRA